MARAAIPHLRLLQALHSPLLRQTQTLPLPHPSASCLMSPEPWRRSWGRAGHQPLAALGLVPCRPGSPRVVAGLRARQPGAASPDTRAFFSLGITGVEHLLLFLDLLSIVRFPGILPPPPPLFLN